MIYHSWGNYPKTKQTQIAKLHWRNQDFPQLSAANSYLPFGNGRSYGDSCLNNQAALIHTIALNKFISFDAEHGILRCEAGVLLADILQLIIPQGWFLAVTPGTKYVTVGGAIANDVHGKNHHIAGSFGCHVRQFELLRSDNSRTLCSLQQHPDLFAATIGGLGLTGIITWAEIQLVKIDNPFFTMHTQTFANLTEFFAINATAEKNYAYTLAWLDCLSQGEYLGRGVFVGANHAGSLTKKTAYSAPSKSLIKLPITQRYQLQLINQAYYYRHKFLPNATLTHYEPYLYPLDKVNFKQKSFLQFQCVIPSHASEAAITEMVQLIANSNEIPYIAVLKTFADIKSPGMLSFPRPGTTLAVDFLLRGASTLNLLRKLTHIVVIANGAIYPAKDAQMQASDFSQFYPNVMQFKDYVDPAFSSSFWRRVNNK